MKICHLCKNHKHDHQFQDVHAKICIECLYTGLPEQGPGGSKIPARDREIRFVEKGELYCNQCNTWFPKGYFYRNKNMKYGYCYTCKACMRDNTTDYRKKKKTEQTLKEGVKNERETPAKLPDKIVEPDTSDFRSKLLKQQRNRSRIS